jgi:hypothetical protein
MTGTNTARPEHPPCLPTQAGDSHRNHGAKPVPKLSGGGAVATSATHNAKNLSFRPARYSPYSSVTQPSGPRKLVLPPVVSFRLSM